MARANYLAGSGSAPVSRGDRLDVPAYNIATGRETSVNDLAHFVGNAIGVTPVIEYADPRLGELARSCLDVSKAEHVLGWTPQVSFDEGMKALAGWFEGTVR